LSQKRKHLKLAGATPWAKINRNTRVTGATAIPFRPVVMQPTVAVALMTRSTPPQPTADHVLASSCLPFLMHAVEIGGERYWDGGFIANPALFPLIYECDARDIILVHVTPSRRPGFPVTANSILSRMQEVSLNSSLMREMRAVAYVNKWIDQGKMTGGKQILVHVINAADVISGLPNSSKLNGDWDFLMYLHDIGRSRTADWLLSNFDRLGVESSIDLQTNYL
jgi:NTE family protein